jgi:hypothetical protein
MHALPFREISAHHSQSVVPFPSNGYRPGIVADDVKNSILTPEQLQLVLKLQGIFMPHATKQRRSYFKNPTGQENPSARFVHYTSADAALGIFNSKRLWMRNAKCMSDYREVQHGFEIFRNFFSKNNNEKTFIEGLDVCVPGVAKEAIALFNQWWVDIQFNTYVTSISEHDEKEDFHGRLSMWRAFGGNAARVAIVFNIPWISGAGRDLHVEFSPVAYLSEAEVHAVMHEVFENIRVNSAFLSQVDRKAILAIVFVMLTTGVCCLKHEGFREEREWRCIYAPKRWPSTLMESATESIGGVPQIVYKIPCDATVSPALAGIDISRTFDRLIIGPSQYPLAMHEAFSAALTKAGIADAGKRIFISNIPIRT